MGINPDPHNLDTPGVKASAVLLLCKYWDPAILNPKKSQEEVLNEVSLLVVSQVFFFICIEFNSIIGQSSQSY